MAHHIIHVKSQSFSFDVDQLNCEVMHGEHQITWILPVGGVRFEFADPPLSFYGENPLPFFRQPGNDSQSVTYTDRNQNSTGKVISYAYQVHLKAGNVLITYPYMRNSPLTPGDPYIRNRPA